MILQGFIRFREIPIIIGTKNDEFWRNFDKFGQFRADNNRQIRHEKRRNSGEILAIFESDFQTKN